MNVGAAFWAYNGSVVRSHGTMTRCELVIWWRAVAVSSCWEECTRRGYEGIPDGVLCSGDWPGGVAPVRTSDSGTQVYERLKGPGSGVDPARRAVQDVRKAWEQWRSQLVGEAGGTGHRVAETILLSWENWRGPAHLSDDAGDGALPSLRRGQGHRAAEVLRYPLRVVIGDRLPTILN